MPQKSRLEKLYTKVETLYQNHPEELLFHGWHHIVFVYKKSKVFAESLNANTFLVQSSALVHDLNYLVDTKSSPNAGEELRQTILLECDYTPEEIAEIEEIILTEEIGERDAHISLNAQALSDADTLFKALPTTSIFFTSRYISETKTDIKKLAQRIVSEQEPLIENGIYFYSSIAKEKYELWAKTNLQLWKNVQNCLDDEEVIEMLTTSNIL